MIKVAEKTTDSNGNYSFSDKDIGVSGLTNTEKSAVPERAKHIKGPKNNNRWNGTYYNYYIVFEYDGVKYTSTKEETINGEYGTTYRLYTADINYKINSNARERTKSINSDIDIYPDIKTRKDFNNQFSKINNQSIESGPKITYTTINDEKYIPQSIYNENKSLTMQSSTNTIDLRQYTSVTNMEDKLQYINLGLRGKDSLDLSLTSNISEINVTVNGQSNSYKYDDKIPIRQSDIISAEDMANIQKETKSGVYVDEEGYIQKIRNTDINKEKTGSNYRSTGLDVLVTYKITVKNESQTPGLATKIINYYDNKYQFEGAYIANTQHSENSGQISSDKKYTIINISRTLLKTDETMDVYVTYRLINPEQSLKSLTTGVDKIPNYNMSEIYEYQSGCGSEQNEHTRGLIDKDSAPGSANIEKARLTGNKESTDTTREYYFKAKNLINLRYEDDTCATPILYYTSNDDGGKPLSGRKITGTIFRDETQKLANDIKTGNGIQDAREVGVYGAIVELIEIKGDSTEKRYTVTTDENGNYTFEDFLPGKYIILYYYGKDKNSVLLHQYKDGQINQYSYNGEDYQSTNNIGAYGAKKLYGIKYNENKKRYEDETEYWYAFNESEGVSTGTDFESYRQSVTNKVTDFTDEEMTVLNRVRKGENITQEELNKLISDTQMCAYTPEYILTVEETVKTANNKVEQPNVYKEYEVRNMNFGIAEVPVTTIDLQKHINEVTIKDASDQNTIIKVTRDEENKDTGWKVTVGEVLAGPEFNVIDASIEDKKLQGAKLKITYNISIDMTTEKDFRDKEKRTIPKIKGIIDFVDNNLSYNPENNLYYDSNSGETLAYWELGEMESYVDEFKVSQYKPNSVPKGTVDPDGKKYTVYLKATKNNPILLQRVGKAECPITLERVLSAPNLSIESIITSMISDLNIYEYENWVEITELDYGDAKSPDGSIIYRDRIRNPNKFIILAGVQYDNARSEIMTIHPPTGGNKNVQYYIVAAISLSVLVTGVVLIKKYVLETKKA